MPYIGEGCGNLSGNLDMDQLRSSVLYKDEVLYVICVANYGNFPKGVPLMAIPQMVRKSGLPYPKPKWIACDYSVCDLDGDTYCVAQDRYGALKKGFVWVN